MSSQSIETNNFVTVPKFKKNAETKMQSNKF